MRYLKVRLFGNIVAELELNPAKEYTAGRGDSCDILLQPEKGISRQHFKLFLKDDTWVVEVVSKFGDLFHNGEKIQTLDLSDNAVFQVPPYEFEFVIQKEVVATSEVKKSPVTQAMVHSGSTDNSDDFAADSERTMVGKRVEVPYLRMVATSGEEKQLLRLAGNGWVAGRDASTDIVIDDSRVSRRQFEILHTAEGYFIRDLESVNGTLLNGNPIPGNQSVRLKSGDSITVLDNHFYFEMRDPEFQNKVRLSSPIAEAAPLQAIGHQAYALPSPAIYYAPPGDGAEHIPQTPQKRSFKRPPPMQLALGAILVLLGAYYVSDMNPAPVEMTQAKDGNPFSKLSPEKQNLVKHSYQMSKNLYMKGSYQLAFQELGKLHEIIPDYKDSKEIEQYCQQAILMQKEIENEERKGKEMEERQQKVTSIIQQCQRYVTTNPDPHKLEDCLQPALELDPENELVLALRGESQRLIDLAQMKSAERAAYLAKVKRRQELFTKAESVEKTGGYLKAIKAYTKFKESSLPDPNQLEKKADRNIASIQRQIGEKVAVHTDAAKKSESAQDYRGAFMHLQSALSVDPRRTDLRSNQIRILSELNKRMKSIYQESVLEESLGKMEDAKTKWRKIISSSVPEEEYFSKAQIKLRNHGESE